MEDRISFRSVRSAFLRSGYEVRLLSPPSMRRMDGYRSRTDGAKVLGLVLPDRGEIAVSSGQDRESQIDTLVHEMVHVYDDSMPEGLVEETGRRISASLTPASRKFLEMFL